MPSGPSPVQARARSRFVTACQQLLALAVVCAGLTPALGVVSLDVVAEAPAGQAAGTSGVLMAAYGQEALKTSRLPSGPVTAHLREIALTGSGVVRGKATGKV